MICFDIETLGVRSHSVVLSMGCVMFDFNDVETFKGLTMDEIYDRYVATGLMVKLQTKPQFAKGRTMDKDAVEWWKKQGEVQKRASFYMCPELDQPILDSVALVDKYVHGEKKPNIIWTRGSLDNVCFDDLCRDFGREPPMEYHHYMDVRTALNLTKETASRGYCEVPDFDTSKVIKHHPVHDAAYDVMMLVYGK
jgi:hypothetical protein